MNRLKIRSSVSEGEVRTLTCPKCGTSTQMQCLNSKTRLYYISIQIKQIHNKKIAVCPSCKSAFEFEAK